MMRLARVCSFFRLCHRAAAPLFAGNSMAASEGAIDDPYGVCAVKYRQAKPIVPTTKQSLIAAFMSSHHKDVTANSMIQSGYNSTVWG
jgi:hypothetical protein